MTQELSKSFNPKQIEENGTNSGNLKDIIELVMI